MVFNEVDHANDLFDRNSMDCVHRTPCRRTFHHALFLSSLVRCIAFTMPLCIHDVAA